MIRTRVTAWMVARLAPSRGDWSLVASACVLLLGAFPAFRAVDPDLFARVATGELIAHTGMAPRVDSFAFTPTKPIWHDHEWLISLVFYYLARAGGDLALLILKVAMFAGTLFLTLRTQRALGCRSVGSAVWLLVLLPELFNGFLPNVRCQMVTMLGVALWMFVAVRTRESPSESRYRQWLPLTLPPLMVLWANSHGGFVVGLVQSALFFLGCIHRKDAVRGIALLSLIGCLAAVLVNPWGFSYLQFMFEAALHPRPMISEWGALSPVSLRWWIVSIVALILAVGTVRAPRTLAVDQYALLGVSLWQAYSSSRLVPIFAILVAGLGFPLAQAAFQGVREWWAARISVLRDAAVGAFAVLLLAAVFFMCTEISRTVESPQRSLYFDTAAYPAEAVTWLCENRESGNILVHFNQASYVLWALRGQFKVAIDGRYEEVYPEETFYRALSAIDPSDPDHLESLAWVNPDYIITHEINPNDSGAFPGFSRVFDAESWTVWEASRIQDRQLSLVERVPQREMSPGLHDNKWQARCRSSAPSIREPELG